MFLRLFRGESPRVLVREATLGRARRPHTRPVTARAMSLEPAELSPREAAELILRRRTRGGTRPRPRPRALTRHARPARESEEGLPAEGGGGGGGGGGERATATPRRPPGAPRPARPRTDEPIVPSSGKPERKRSRLDLTEHLTRDATPPLLPSPPVASRRPDEPERKRRRRAPVRIQPDVEDDARMGNRGVLGLERLSRAQQREFWRLAARGKSAPEEAEDEEAKLSKEEEAKGEDAADERTKVAGVDPTRARGRFRGVTRYKRTGRYEAHIWDRGRQKHLGSFADAAAAAAAYDKTAIKFRGWDASPLNFPAESYAADDEFRRDLATLTKGEFVAKTCAAGRAGRRAGGGGPGDASASAKDPRSTDPRPSGLTLADALVRAQMLEDPGCAPKPQHVLTLAPPGCAETSHSGSESGSGGSGAGSGTNSERNSVSDSDSRDDALDPRRNVAVDPPTGSTPPRHPLGTVDGHPLGTVGGPPPPPRGRPRARPRFHRRRRRHRGGGDPLPRRAPRGGVAHVGLANARGRAVGCRGGAEGVPTTTGRRLNRVRTRRRAPPRGRWRTRPSTTTTAENPRPIPRRRPPRRRHPSRHPSRHPPRHPTSPTRASPCTPAPPPPRARSNAGFKRGDTSSSHKGVTRHRRSGRWEAHMWSRELGKQLYLGGFDAECEAARAFDVCSLKKWRDERGASATAAGTSPAGSSKAPGLNFPPGEYRDLVPALDSMSLEGVIAAVRQGKLREHRA